MGTMIAYQIGLNENLIALASQLPPEVQVEPNSFHLTLCYTPDDETIDISGIIPYPPADAELMVFGVRLFPADGSGQFPIVAIVDKDPELDALHRALLERTPNPSEYSGDNYNPHITLGYSPTPNITLPSLSPFVVPCSNIVQVGDDHTLKEYVHGTGGLLSEPATESKPYTGADDPNIPSNVPESKRENWVNIFNQVLTDTGDEERAFGVANAYLQNDKSLTRLWHWLTGDPDLSKDYGFKVFEDDTFIGWYSNAYEDREGEILARKGFEEDIARMEDTGNYPELRFWHIPGTAFGMTKAVAVLGRFVIAIGKLDSSPLAKALKPVLQSRKDWGMSHGFVYDPNTFDGRTYQQFSTFEISVLPNEEAANALTGFDIAGGDMSMINPKAIAALEKALEGSGVDVNTLIAKGLAETAKADQSFDYKSIEATLQKEMMVEAEFDMAGLMDRVAGLENAIAELLATRENAAMVEEMAVEEEVVEEEEPREEVVVRSLSDEIRKMNENMMAFMKQQSQKQSVQKQVLDETLEDFFANGQKQDDRLPVERTIGDLFMKQFHQGGK